MRFQIKSMRDPATRQVMCLLTMNDGKVHIRLDQDESIDVLLNLLQAGVQELLDKEYAELYEG